MVERDTKLAIYEALKFLTNTFRMIESHFHSHCVLKLRNKQNKTYFIFIFKDN